MRILHTSDWHLGQHFMGQSRQAEHRALIDWLLTQVNTHAVDAVLIAGDIFDTGAPPSYARELYNQLIAGLHRAGVALLVLGGNHDSVSVLSESRELLGYLNTQVIAAVGDSSQHVLTLPLRGTNQPGCIVCALPFIRPRDVMQSQAGQSAQDKQLTLQAAIARTYEQVFSAALARQSEMLQSTGHKLPIVATGHLTTVGASSNESVREIYVGSLEAFPTTAFPAADYIALGHIHRPQKVAGLAHIQYSGSPIALGFDEAKQSKQVLLIGLDANGLQSVQPLQVPVFQPMAAISARLADLPAHIQAAVQTLNNGQQLWLEITVLQDDYLSDLAARIDTITQDLPVQVLRIKRLRGNATAQLFSDTQESLDELSPQEVFARRLAQETLEPATQQALTQRYDSVLRSLREGDEAAQNGAVA